MLILVSGHIITDENRLEELVSQYQQAVAMLQNYHKRGTTFENDPEREAARKKADEKESGWIK